MHRARLIIGSTLVFLASSIAMAAGPSITSLTPTSGAVGATVTIAGSGFGSTQGTSTVTFNGTAAAPTNWSANSITVTVPSGATTGNVVVTVSGKASNGQAFTVLGTPTISSVTPALGPVGTVVTIAGSNFGATQGSSTVQFNGTLAAPSSWSSGSITIAVPAGATTGNVIVHASGVDSNGVVFTVPPIVNSLTPSSGAVGSSIVIAGSNFGSSQGGVTFNGTAATITNWNASNVTATVPSSATSGNVVVTAVGGAASNGVSFTVVPAPGISNLNPNVGAALSSVAITGSNFGSSQGNGSVTFNGVAATVSSWGNNSISTFVPAAATSGNVVVAAAGGVSSNGVIFTVTNPNITGVSPSSGFPGASVSITGSNFGATQGNSTVTFNGEVAVPTSWASNSISVPVPAGAASGNVIVTVSGEPSNGVPFTVLTQPTITKISPSTGAVGNAITITGSNFGTAQGASTLTFNGVQAIPTSWSATTIVAPVPGGATTGNIVVTVGGQASNGVLFTVSATNTAPSLSSISPPSGAIGTTVTIGGNNFGAAVGDSNVWFSGSAGPVGGTIFVQSWSNTSFLAQVPTGAVTGPVFVEVGGQNSNGLCFALSTSTPCINTLSPASGSSGTVVTISGINFGSRQGQSTVTVNGVTATVSSWSSTSIQFSVPATASSGNVIVTVGGIASNSLPFTVPGPVITNLSPDAGRTGASVTITGIGFGATQGSSTVKFNGTTATPSSWSSNVVVAPVPTGATTGPVVVTVANLPSGGVTFTVTSAPTISSISPTSGPVNTTVTVTGSGFGSPQGTGTISFNGTPAAPFSWSDGAILVPVPAGAATGPVVVTAGGTNSNGSTFTVVPPPAITSLSTSSGAPGSSVTINGSNFGTPQGNSSVKFNGVPATVTSWATGAIAATVPNGASTGPVTVTVSGQASNGVTFTVLTNGTLSGTVSNASGGAGISGATLQLLQNGSIKTSATTNSSGTYTISSVAAGSYDVQVSATGFGTAFQSPLTIVANQTVTSNFSLSSPGTVSGKVTHSDGVTAISGASVQALVGREVATTATTDATGSYSIGGLNVGSYTVEASASGYVTKGQAVTLSGGATSTANFALQTPGNGPITYVFDELGRLIGAIDSSGDAATYTYDAVGNILAIGRSSSTQVSIISFTPSSGLVGASVTIYGTAFSTTASQNTVKFNGTTATVTSATATQIVTSAPSGATTGPITVTTPAGSATSATNFTVNTSSGAPTITSFTPPSGVAGTVGTEGSGAAVTINGTNFDTLLANDKITFNITRADTQTANSGTLTTTVPSQTASGRISVATPNGSAVSSQDFYIPFKSHIATDIGYTGRTTLGNSATITLSQASKIGLLLFDASAGQHVALQLSGSTFATCTLYVIDPKGKVLMSSDCTSATTSPGGVTLSTTGTYSIGIDPGANTGSITVSLVPDVTGTITIDGPAVTITTTVPFQDARLSFSGTIGQRIVMEWRNTTTLFDEIDVINPDGSTVANAGSCCHDGVFALPLYTLPASGPYQLSLKQLYNGLVGSVTFQMLTVPPDFTATLTVPAAGQTGPAVQVPTSGNLAPGQIGILTFSGTAAQLLSFNVMNPTFGTATSDCGFRIYDPNNAQVNIGLSGYCGTGGAHVTLTATLGPQGTYTMKIVPSGNGTTGSVSISINNDADVTGTIAIDGPAVTTTTTVAGQDARLSFSATAGQRIVVYATNMTNPGATLNLVEADGKTIQTTIGIGSGFQSPVFIDTQTLATTGTYQLWVQHSGTKIGSETLQIASVPADVSGSVTIGGSAFSFTTVAGQDANVTFSNPQSQSVTVHWTSSTYPSSLGCNMKVTGPSPSTTQVGLADCTASAGTLSLGTQPAGTYNILIDPRQQSTGGLSLTVTTP